MSLVILQRLLILAIFAAGGWAMFTRRLPSLLALPAMALGVAVVALIRWEVHLAQGSVGGIFADCKDILHGVVTEGALRLSSNYVIIIFAGMLAVFLSKTGVAKEIVKTAAELGGDEPRHLAILMLLAIAGLFSVLSGLGSIIMVGMIVLPMLLSLDVAPEAAACLLLFGVSIGGILNPVNWSLYLGVFHLEPAVVRGFALPMCGITMAAALVFVWREFPGSGEASGGRPVLVPLPGDASHPLRSVLRALSGLGVAGHDGIRPIMVFLPFLPLMLILGAGFEEIPAFAFTVLVGVALHGGSRKIDLLVSIILEGLQSVGPAVAILMGLGMLLKALTLPVSGGTKAAVPQLLAPLVKAVIPTTPVGFVLVFTLLSPLALYRGPLNLWGMGFGLAEVIRTAGGLAPALVMGMLQAVGQVQGICDPTNTYNIWVAGQCGVTTRRIMVKTMPYAVTIAFLGLVLAATHFRGEFPISR